MESVSPDCSSKDFCGLYYLNVSNGVGQVPVFCKNGWTQILARGQFGNPQDYFDRTFVEMKHPFGHPIKEFWLGLNNIFALTNNGIKYTIKFELNGVNNVYHETFYTNFTLLEDEFYTLHYDSFLPGPSTTSNSWSTNGMKFTAKDADHDTKNNQNCAVSYNGPNW